MTASTTLSFADGILIAVPDSLDLITPYVLCEQQDWFENEIRLLRRLLQAGDKVIDIGANYGVYTLSMARTVGPSGAVWAFEPASATAELLARSVELNGFKQVTLDRSAVSSAAGTARLTLHHNSELNALERGGISAAGGASESVPLVTLDGCREKYNWQDIGFVKIDAEGEERNILKGGVAFFTELSPLVQYEIKAGEGLQLELVQAFADLGYASYRLVPGLDLLVPFGPGPAQDDYLLNLFCCKPDRAALLARRGFLLDGGAAQVPQAAPRHGWRSALASLPYGLQLEKLWEQAPAADDRVKVEQALGWYACSKDMSLSAAERFGALEAAFKLLNELCLHRPDHLRRASLARVAQDYGARSVAIDALRQLATAISERGEVDLSEPFLAPGERFDYVSVGESFGNWAYAGVIEQLELLSSYSSFYVAEMGRPRLELIRSLGFGSDEMERRLDLLQQRFGPGRTA
jgi:protein O-GlcNAc transferase